MPIASGKIVQSYIQALIEVVDLVQKADDVAQYYKSKFVFKNPDLTGTNITQAQINAVNAFLSDINDLATGQVATIVRSKDVPSQGTRSLD